MRQTNAGIATSSAQLGVRLWFERTTRTLPNTTALRAESGLCLAPMGAPTSFVTKDWKNTCLSASSNRSLVELAGRRGNCRLCSRWSMSSLCLYCSAECRRQFRSWTRRKSDVDLTHSLVVCSTHHESALTWFARKNTMRLAEVLLNRCNDEGIDLETRRGQTALTIACREGHYAMVRLLLERGANPNYETTRGLYVIRCCQLFAEMRV